MRRRALATVALAAGVAGLALWVARPAVEAPALPAAGPGIADATRAPDASPGGRAREEGRGGAAAPSSGAPPRPGHILVVDGQAGAPAAAWVLLAWGDSPDELQAAWGVGRTDDDGILSLDAIDARRLPPAARCALARDDAGRLGGPVAFDLDAVRRDGLRIELGDGATIAGRVVAHGTGAALAGVRVWACPPVGPLDDVVSARDGAFRFIGLLPGVRYGLTAAGPGLEAVVHPAAAAWLAAHPQWGAPGTVRDALLSGQAPVAGRPGSEALRIELRPLGHTILLLAIAAERAIGVGGWLVLDDGPIEGGLSLSVAALAAGVARVDVSEHRGRKLPLLLMVEGFDELRAAVDVPIEAGEFTAEVTLREGPPPATGLVVDEAGRPLPDVAIIARTPGETRWRWDSDGPNEDARSDADGRFPLERTSTAQAYVAIQPGRGCSSWVESDGREAVRLTVVAGNVVTGFVRDTETLAPAAGARVRATIVGARDEGPVVETDAAGRYVIAGIPPGMVVRPEVLDGHRFGGPDALPSHAGDFELADAPRLLAAGEAVRFDDLGQRAERDLAVRALPGQEVTFRLEFPAGAAIPARLLLHHRCRLELSGDQPDPYPDGVRGWSFARSHRHGVTRLVAEGGGTVAIDPADPRVRVWCPLGRNWIRLADDGWLAEPPPRDVTGAAAPAEERLPVRPRARISAQLVDEGGTPVRRDRINIEVRGVGRPSRVLGYGHTDPNGSADVTALLLDPDGSLNSDSAEFQPASPSGIELRVWQPGLRHDRDGRTLPQPGCALDADALAARLAATVQQGRDLELLVVVREQAAVSLRVQVMAGRDALAGAVLRGEPATLFVGDAWQTTGVDGIAEFQVRALRGFRIVLDDPQRVALLDLGDDVQYPPSPTRDREGRPLYSLSAHPAVAVVVDVRDPQGRALGVRELAIGGNGGDAGTRARSDPSGRAVFRVVEGLRGRALAVHEPGGRFFPARVTVGPAEPQVAVLRRPIAARVVVRPAPGFPPGLLDDRLGFALADPSSGEQLAPPQAWFDDTAWHLTLPARLVRLRIDDDAGLRTGDVVFDPSVTPTAELMVSLAPGARAVRFQIRGPDGEPLAGRVVTLNPHDDDGAQWYQSATTGSDGELTIWLPAGRYNGCWLEIDDPTLAVPESLGESPFEVPAAAVRVVVLQRRE